MEKTLPLYEVFDSFAEPYIGERAQRTPENLEKAKKALLNLLSIMQQTPFPTEKSYSTDYLVRLGWVYIFCVKGDYFRACNKVSDLLYWNRSEEAYYGLALLLQKLKTGNFSA